MSNHYYQNFNNFFGFHRLVYKNTEKPAEEAVDVSRTHADTQVSADNPDLPAGEAKKKGHRVIRDIDRDFDQMMARARRQEELRMWNERYAQKILKNTKGVANRAVATRRYLQRNNLDYKEAGLILENPEDFSDDKKLVAAVLKLQYELGLPEKDAPQGQDGMFGQETYRLALGQGVADESVIARISRSPNPIEAAGTAVDALITKAARVAAARSARSMREANDIALGVFTEDPDFKKLLKRYKETAPKEHPALLLRAAHDLRGRLAKTYPMQFVNDLVRKYLGALTQGEADQNNLVQIALEQSRTTTGESGMTPVARIK